MHKHILEPAAQEFAEATSQPPFLYELGPAGARKVLDVFVEYERLRKAFGSRNV